MHCIFSRQVSCRHSLQVYLTCGMWHSEARSKKTLSGFLGLSQEEYVCWMISSDESWHVCSAAAFPNRDLPYCARHRLEGLKEQLEQAVQTLLSLTISRCSRPTAPTGAATDTACRYGVSAERADLQGAGATPQAG